MKHPLKEQADPYGLLAEPTSAEMQEWEQSPHLSDNPYTLFGWLINKRKNILIEKLKQ